MSGRVLWRPSVETMRDSTMGRFMAAQGLDDYEALWRWSVADVARFWNALWSFFEIQADGDPSVALADSSMPGARWFPEVAISYPERVFAGRDPQAVALHHASELRELDTWSWDRLRQETARIRAGLTRLGVGRGDRVVAFMPNIPETMAAFLAVSSLGATWACCSPDFGTRSVIDRFAQIEPAVLLTVDGYRYGGRDFDRRPVVDELRETLSSLRRVVTLGFLDPGTGDWDEVFPATDEALVFERVPFDHPLWILYSSGTTGLPKAIVHGHGGILLDHLKWHCLHGDLQAGDRFFWFTTTGWMMWNALVSGLLTEAEVVLFDGNPVAPDPAVLWDLAERAGVTTFGTSAAYIHGCMKSGTSPRADGRALSSLKAIGSTGSPLSEEGFEWVYQELGESTWLFSTSGGTDVCTPFVGGSPLKPVRVGELQARALGVAVEAWDEDGRPVVDEVGELVVTKPMPSMPIRFWNDPDGTRYRESYFDMFPGVWRHGDWIRLTPEGGATVYGRSDATINRGGIRMGTAEIYSAVLRAEEVVDALVVDVPDPNGTGASWMPLFVVLREGAVLDDALRQKLARLIRTDASPRHVPDEVIAIDGIPRTRTGKLLEVPVKKVLMGRDPERAASRDALQNPEAFDWFVEYARRRSTGAPA
ncbi:MAG TPA: acetoacetate--CoA ligase [Solirubrobacteraceae bacterium]